MLSNGQSVIRAMGGRSVTQSTERVKRNSTLSLQSGPGAQDPLTLLLPGGTPKARSLTDETRSRTVSNTAR